jgi:hypothetical protein
VSWCADEKPRAREDVARSTNIDGTHLRTNVIPRNGNISVELLHRLPGTIPAKTMSVSHLPDQQNYYTANGFSTQSDNVKRL